LASCASAWHTRCNEVLSPRDDRALPRQARLGAELVQARAPPQSRLLASLGGGRCERRGMKRYVVLAACAAALVLPEAASAHPLGNFTVNRFSRVEVADQRVYIRYVLDLAEIPTFQAGAIDADTYARRI